MYYVAQLCIRLVISPESYQDVRSAEHTIYSRLLLLCYGSELTLWLAECNAVPRYWHTHRQTYMTAVWQFGRGTWACHYQGFCSSICHCSVRGSVPGQSVCLQTNISPSVCASSLSEPFHQWFKTIPLITDAAWPHQRHSIKSRTKKVSYLLSFRAESFVFQFFVQNYKD